MALRRSSLLLLSALLAMLAVPASALAQTPLNTTAPAPTPPTWRATPYVVNLQGTDSSGTTPADTMHWGIGALSDSPTDPPANISIVANGAQAQVLTSGKQMFKTRAVHSSIGSAWRAEELWIDLIAPTDVSAATTSPAATGWFLAFTSFEIRANDAHSGVHHVEWSVDGELPTRTGPSGSSVVLATNGPHVIRTRAVDVVGNESDWIDHYVRVDSVLPTDTTVLPTGWRTAPVDVTVKGVDAHSGVDEVSWIINGGAPVTGSPDGQFTLTADGEHTVQTIVRDNAGNESGWKMHTVKIDRTIPTNVTHVSDGLWHQSYHALVEGSDNDASGTSGSGIARVEWQIDGGAWLNASPSKALDFTATGVYQLRTRVRDVAGNVSIARLDTVRVDADAPTNTTNLPAPGDSSNPYQVAVTGDDGTDSGVNAVEWKIDGVLFSGAPGAFATVTGHGPHELETRVRDAAGNWSPWRSDDITIDGTIGDNVLPIDTTVGGSNTVWRKNSATITMQAVDADSGVDRIEYSRPGILTDETTTPPAPLTISDEGDNIVETRVFDRKGNQTLWKRHHVMIDASLPVDTIEIPTGWQRSGTEFTLSATDAHSGVDEILYTIDGGPEQVGHPGDPVDVGADGTYVIKSRVRDNVGHSSGFTTRTLKVDTTSPANTSAPAPTAWQRTAFSLDLSGTDGGSGYDKMQWRFGPLGGPPGEIHDGGRAEITQDGVYKLETRALDLAGNDSGWRAETVSIDTTKPVNTTPAAPTGWRNTPYTIETFTGTDAGSHVGAIEVEVHGSAVSNPYTISGDGEHPLRSRILDVAGNDSGWRDELIKIDTVAPQAALSCSSAANAWSRVPVSCSVTAADDRSGIGSATLAGTDGGTAAVANGTVATVSSDGGHTLRLDAVDVAGNSAATEATVYVDRTAPPAGLSCAAADGKYACRADASDGASGLVALGWSLDGGAFEPIAAGATFTVAKGKVRLRAVDAAGNETITETVTLAAIPVGAKVRISNVPVYLKGRNDSQSMLGALNAVRSATGTVSLDLRPLAVGRGTYRVEIALKSGKHSKKVKRNYKVGRTGALPRISASLSKAVEKTTITLTVRKKVGKRWRNHAGTRLVLAK